MASEYVYNFQIAPQEMRHTDLVSEKEERRTMWETRNKIKLKIYTAEREYGLV